MTARMFTPQKITLITNVRYIELPKTLGRLDCKALMIEEKMPGLFDHSKVWHQLRAFGPDGAWPVWDLRLTPAEHDRGEMRFNLNDVPCSQFILGDNGDLKPIRVAVDISFFDYLDLQLTLTADDPAQPFDIYVTKRIDYEMLWAELRQRVSRYVTTPFKPQLQWVANQNWRSDEQPKS